MKNLAIIFSILLITISASAFSKERKNTFGRSYDGNAYIFVEGDVEFSVFPDGQFDFVYIGPQNGSQIILSSPQVNISYNSGYNYDTYIQYDMYGAVIQIENVPIYYDEYGRISSAGNVDIRYNDRRIVRVGGMHILYNHYGKFSHCSGVINTYNPYYVYHPWHVYYARPIYTHVIVYDYPYRKYYTPSRYSFHDHIRYYKNRNNTAYANGRRDFYQPGSRLHNKNGRITRNTNFNPNRRNTMISNTGKSNQVMQNNSVNDSKITRNPNEVRKNNTISNSTTSTNTNNNRTTRTNSNSVKNKVTIPVRTSKTQNNQSSNNTALSNNSRSVRDISIQKTTKIDRNNNQNRTNSKAPTRTTSRQNNTMNTSRSTSSSQNNRVRTRG